MNMERNKKLNRIVNMIYPIQGNSIYFSLKNMSLSNNCIKDSIELSKWPVFDSAEKILNILEHNNIEFKETNIKILK